MPGGDDGGDLLYVAVGLWVENAVVLLHHPASPAITSGTAAPGSQAEAAARALGGGTSSTSSRGGGGESGAEAWGGMRVACRLELGEQQPRSLAALDVGGRCVFLAGTSQGQVRGQGIAG